MIGKLLILSLLAAGIVGLFGRMWQYLRDVSDPR